MTKNREMHQERRLIDPALEDYEKALRLLVERERRQTTMPNPSSSFFLKKQEQKSVNALLRTWRQQDRQVKAPRPQFREPSIQNPRSTSKDSTYFLNPQYAPVFFATIFLMVGFLLMFLTPGSLLTGLFNRVSPSLPKTTEARQMVLAYATPMGEDRLSQNLSDIDTSRFRVLSSQDYVVQPGDTLSGIALKYNLNMDTIISFNNITNPRAMRIGQVYKIPNRDGLLYKVVANDSLEKIAQKFETTVVALLDANDLTDEAVEIGKELFIPGARMNSTDLKLLLGELFMWPAQGRFTSGYGYRSDPFTGQRRFHNGVDVANAVGTPIRAALAGRVVSVESQIGNYGKVIIIQHPRGFKTLYAHLNSFNVQVGQSVAAGQMIGRMGNTGRSTGPHLHFSVILNGAFVNPLRYLK